MSETGEVGTGQPISDPVRCKNCDSVIPAGNDVCLMCGAPAHLAPAHRAQTHDAPARRVEHTQPDPDDDVTPPEPTLSATGMAPAGPSVFETVVVERQSRAVLWMTGVAFIVTLILGSLVMQRDEPVQLALAPTNTPIPPTATRTPSVTLDVAAGDAATGTATMTPEPSATPTLQPPRVHQVGDGETLFGLAYIYNVSMDVIADLNGFSVESPIQSGQSLQIPWPTATPPLEPVEVVINGEPVIADPTDCERYEIQAGDALSVIAARNNINFDLLLQVNRLTDQSIMQPGDTVCIPRVVYGEVLPPTPGPSPTPSATSFPPGPLLLYPTDRTVVDIRDEPIVLQWLAVKDLAPEEWYMIELTDLDVADQHPQRAFTRDNAYRVPGSWRPPVDEYHAFRWRVSIVRVSGQREDGGFIYTFGGRYSEDATFTWQGAVPTPTPTSTPTPTPTPQS